MKKATTTPTNELIDSNLDNANENIRHWANVAQFSFLDHEYLGTEHTAQELSWATKTLESVIEFEKRAA